MSLLKRRQAPKTPPNSGEHPASLVRARCRRTAAISHRENTAKSSQGPAPDEPEHSLTENNRFPAWGVAGGKAEGTSKVVLNPGCEGEKEIRPFSDDNPWQAGDLVRIYTAGGGGWGDPLEREIHLVEKDVRGGFVSLESARSEYGVVIDPETLKTDGPGSLAFRKDLRRGREQPKLFHRFIYFDEEEERRWIERHLPR